jgi:SAM-dependent methyltransferase
MNIEELTKTLIIDENGILRKLNDKPLAYPKGQNKRCFQVEDQSFWFRHRNNCIISAIKRFLPNGMIVDLGGGNGYVTRRMLDEGFDAVLLEPGPVGAFNGKVERKLPLVICSTLEDVNFPENSIDAIGCFDVIEHIRDDHLFIDDIQRVLKPGGLLYVTVPAYEMLWSGHDVHAQHFRRYTKEKITKLLDRNFDLLYFTYLFNILVLPTFVLKTLPFRLGLSKGTSILSFESEHGTESTMGVNIINGFLKREEANIAKGLEVRWGSSCLFVARKIAT